MSQSTQPTGAGRIMKRRGLGYILAFLFALGAFLSGLHLGQGVFAASPVTTQSANIFSSLFAAEPAEITGRPDLSEFWRVWDLLDEKFVNSSSTDELTDEEKIEGAIKGLVNSYNDPYTVYMPPSDAEKFSENISGNFSGVGMEVGLRDGLITVISPLPDTPADKAGVMAGDVVVKIDDISTEDMGIDQAVNLIRGEKGTVVTLRIYRKGETDFLSIPITRDTISIPTVKTEQIDDVFVLSIYTFNAVAEPQVQDALEKYLKSGAKKLVLDLRGNPGGYLQSAVAIASYFLPAGKVVVKEDFEGDEKDDVFRSRVARLSTSHRKTWSC